MAKAKVVHSDDACTLILKDNKNSEPSVGIIKFPGGYVEVTCASDGSYLAHTHIDETAEVVASRIDFKYAMGSEDSGRIPPIPAHEHIKKMMVQVD